MRSFHNIEKSAFRKGEYVGYAGGLIYQVRKSNSSFGNWVAWVRDEPPIYAFRLAELSEKLTAKADLLEAQRKNREGFSPAGMFAAMKAHSRLNRT